MSKVFFKANECLYCYAPPCDDACPNGCLPSKMMLSLRLSDEKTAAAEARKTSAETVKTCKGECMKACVRAKIGTPVAIKSVHKDLMED